MLCGVALGTGIVSAQLLVFVGVVTRWVRLILLGCSMIVARGSLLRVWVALLWARTAVRVILFV